MKKLLMAAILVALATTLAWGTPVCATGASLVTYESYGVGGCTVGTMLFSNFSYSIPFHTATGSYTNVTDAQITVTPDAIAAGWNSLTFSGSFEAAARGLVVYEISYQVTSPLLGADLSLGSHTVPGTGDVNLTEATFPGAVSSLNVFHLGGTPPQHQDFDSVAFNAFGLSIVNDVELSGNVGGASLTSFTNGFHVPEPITMLLVGSGLLGLGLLRRRKHS